MQASGTKDTAASVDVQVRAEKIRILFVNQATSFWLSLVTALVPVGIALQLGMVGPAVTWFGLFALVAVARYAVTRRYLAVRPDAAEASAWARRYNVGAGLAGAVWGLAAWWISITGDASAHLLALFLAYGVVAAAVPLIGMSKAAMLMFQIPVILPVTVWTFAFRPDFDLLLAYILVLYLAGIRISQRKLEGYVDRSYRLKLENQHLIAQLDHSNRQLQAANLDLTQQAGEDELTGLANRRRYQERLELEWRRARRDKSDMAMVVVDVDYFKRYNDSLGHDAGDDCLRRVAALLEQAANRPGDLVARYGGEEFVILLPLTSHKGALMLAQRIKLMIAEAGIAHPASPLGPYLTVSMGVSALTADDDKPARLFKTADEALYEAKSAGRNFIQTYQPRDSDDAASA